MITARWIALVAVGGVISVCGATVLAASTAERIVVGPAASGSQRSIRRGDLLVVRLPSNPSTGFAWKLCAGTDRVLVPAGHTYVPPTGKQRLGAPGTAVLRFRAAATGTTVLRLVYVRPWEKGVPPARTFTLRVTVV